MKAAAWMGRGRGEVEAADGGGRPAEAWIGAKDRLLVELGGAAVDRAADEVAVVALEVERRLDVALDDAPAEARRHPLDLFLHPVGEQLGVLAVPIPAQVPARVGGRALREVGVGP